MKRFQSAFAAPSGFTVSAAPKKASKPGRRSENAHRVSDALVAAAPNKPRTALGPQVRAA